MRTKNLTRIALTTATLSLLASACSDIGTNGPTPSESAEYETAFMELAECTSDLQCAEVDYVALGIAHLESCLVCSCAESPDNPAVDTLQIQFMDECVSDLECVTDLDCADMSTACSAAECLATECIIIPIPDPEPEAHGVCDERTCRLEAEGDQPAGWGITPLSEGTVCDDDDYCSAASYCDGTGICVADPDSMECCEAATDCPEVCDDGELRYCTEPVAEDPFGHCGCVMWDLASEVCDDGVDNDGNGATDCIDAACADAAVCTAPVPTSETSCTDGVDNDEDLHIDCADTDCAMDPACVAAPVPETACTDGSDNDDDGLIDCADPDCAGDPSCLVPTTETSCTDGIDNDEDLHIDCADTDCAEDPACEAPEPTRILIPVGQGVHCWAATTLSQGVPLGTPPSGLVTDTPTAIDPEMFSDLCTTNSGAQPEYILCQRYTDTGADVSGLPPFYEGDAWVTLAGATCEDFGHGCPSAGFDSTSYVCPDPT